MGKKVNICNKTARGSISAIRGIRGQVFDLTYIQVYQTVQDFGDIDLFLEDLVDRLADL